jgi:hypothetical protein
VAVFLKGSALKQIGVLMIAAALGLWAPVSGWAADPVAIVEDVSFEKAGVNFMDYLDAGRVIQLPPGESITLGYLKSCWRETITGGRITVGAKRSAVKGGRVQREKVECDGGRAKITKAQAGKSGVMVFRKGRKAPAIPPPPPERIIYGTSPFITLPGDGRVVIERLDRRGKKYEVDISGGYADLSTMDIALRPGGLYRAQAGKKKIVFQIDRSAQPGRWPIVSRLISFQ